MLCMLIDRIIVNIMHDHDVNPIKHVALLITTKLYVCIQMQNRFQKSPIALVMCHELMVIFRYFKFQVTN